MALQDFFGDYDVKTTSGTDFGIGTRVTIEAEPSDEDAALVSFKTTVAPHPYPVKMTYEEATDSLTAVNPGDGTQLMSISRFVDPKGSGWESIYGIFVPDKDANLPYRLPAWSATAISSSDPTGPLNADDFVGIYRVKTTADVQFGTGSKIEIVQQADHALCIEIINPMGTSLLNTTLTYEPATGSVYGFASPAITGPHGSELLPVTIALSVARTAEGKRVIYGTFTLGDPYQGGTYAGEEEDP